MSIILEARHSLEQRILNHGHVYQNTKELIGPKIALDLSGSSLSEELYAIKDYYGARFDRRYDDEKFHYDALRYAMLHKVKEVEYFHHQGIENRKLVIFSNDCISSIQYLRRQDHSFLLVHMRSSDVRDLLPLDLLALYELQLAVDDVYKAEINSITMDIVIGSAHIYLEGGRS
jgi:thymidylate synthase